MRTAFALTHARRTGAEYRPLLDDLATEEQESTRSQKRRAKKRSISHFLDLPAELRNKIYVELLTLMKENGSIQRHCWLQIVAASKWINNEARRMLYAGNVIDINILYQFCTTGRNPQIWYSMWCAHILKRYDDVPFRDLAYMFRYMNGRWPEFLKNVHHLRLNINLKYHCNHSIGSFLHSVYRRVEPLVATLCWFLVTENNIETCEVKVRIGKPHFASSDRLLKRTLMSLAYLRRPDALTFTGLSEEVANHLRDTCRQYARAPRSPVHYALLFAGLSAVSTPDDNEDRVSTSDLDKAVGRQLKRIGLAD